MDIVKNRYTQRALVWDNYCEASGFSCKAHNVGEA